MKKLFVCVLALTLLCASLFAISEGDVTALVQATGLDFSTTDNPDGSIICDYFGSSSRTSEIQWSDATHLYSVTGDTDTIAQVYVDALALGGWDSCRYLVGKKVRVSFGVKSKHTCETLGDYLEQMQAVLDVAPSDPSDSSKADSAEYVLNTNTKKFHRPTCSSVGQMKQKNRRDYTGSRDDLISQGYDPCKKCNP